MSKIYKAIFTKTETCEFTFESSEDEDPEEKAEELFEEIRDGADYNFDEGIKICEISEDEMSK